MSQPDDLHNEHQVSQAAEPHLPLWAIEDLSRIRQSNRFRSRVSAKRHHAGLIEIAGKEYLDFSSNDYLGMTSNAEVRSAVIKFLTENAFGAGASPLVTGYHPEQEALEKELANFESAESSLIFSSGYVANVSILSALAGPEDLILSDSRNHASLIDGCRLSKAKIERFDTHHLERIRSILSSATGYRARFIVTDSVFSMDGDVCLLDELVALAERFEALIFLDEAHALGTLSPARAGLAELRGLQGRIPFRVGTLSKSLGSVGGFVSASRAWTEYLIQKCRGMTFSTGLPPAAFVAARAALAKVISEPDRLSRLSDNSRYLRRGLVELGWNLGPKIDGPSSPIIPVILGEASAAIELAQELRKSGVWAVAIRPPTVPEGTSRIRLSVTSEHSRDDLNRLLSILGSSP